MVWGAGSSSFKSRVPSAPASFSCLVQGLPSPFAISSRPAPDGDFAGYDFWLNKLNAAGRNYVSAEMVKSFIVSAEYRQRFGP
jgi:hypothetical protein